MIKSWLCRLAKILPIIGLIFGTIWSSGPAWARVSFSLGEEFFPNPVSGQIGGQKKTIRVRDQHAIVQIGLKEVADKPCQILITAQHVGAEVSASQPRYQETKLDLCGGKAAKALRSASLWREGFVNSLQICLNKAEKRAKGLRAYGYPTDWTDGDAKFVKPEMSDSFARPNCKRWQKQVSCGINAVASGLIAHFSDTSGSKLPFLMGLQLICRPLEKSR